MEIMSHIASQTVSRPEHARRLAGLRDAQDDHDAIRIAFRAGAHPTLLARDNRRWETIGEAIADLARLIVGQFAESAFGDARPEPSIITARLSESIDDLLDEPAWTVIDAAARLAAAGSR